MNKYIYIAITAAVTIFCVPISYFLVWFYPKWNKKTKWIWTGCITIWFLFLIVASTMEDNAHVDSFKQANIAWEAGNKAATVEAYRKAIYEHNHPIRVESPFTKDEISLAYGHLIEYYVEEEFIDKAKEVYQESIDNDIAPMITDEMKSKLDL